MKTKNNRLDIVGKRLKAVDRHLVHLLARRVFLAKEVAMIKVEDKTPLYRKEVEEDRLNLVSEWANEEGINPEFARSLLYSIIGESCKQQMMIIDSLRLGKMVEKFTPTYQELQKNLLRLTEYWASRYERYTAGNPATSALVIFERNIIDTTLSGLGNREMCLDLGCATGKEIRRISRRFSKLLGFDISTPMIKTGKEKISLTKKTNVKLMVHDVENSWPLKDGSVSFIIMNNGTASDVKNLTFVFNEVVRVLKPGGRFVMSFYNKEAWTQRIFFPWPLGLVAGIDQDRDCLEVKLEKETIPIFAKPYTLDEVKEMVPRQLCLLSWHTYPTLMSVLPKEIVEETLPKGLIHRLDNELAQTDHGLGSYVIISGERV